METLKQVLPILIQVSLAGLVLSVGLNATRDDLLYVVRRPAQLAKAILAVDLIPPAASALLVLWLPLAPAVKGGIMLMAISPVPPLVPGKEMGVGGRKPYAYGVYVTMALLSVVSVPAVFAIASRIFGRSDTVPVSMIASTILGGVIVPLALGGAIRRFAPKFAAAAWAPVSKISLLLVLIAFLPVLAQSWPTFVAMTGNGALLAMAAATIVALVGGHLLGGPDPRDRATLAIAASTRHPGIAMIIAGSAFLDARVSAAALLFMVVQMVVTMPYTKWVSRRGHAAPVT